jgi:hypothetical protein
LQAAAQISKSDAIAPASSVPDETLPEVIETPIVAQDALQAEDIIDTPAQEASAATGLESSDLASPDEVDAAEKSETPIDTAADMASSSPWDEAPTEEPDRPASPPVTSHVVTGGEAETLPPEDPALPNDPSTPTAPSLAPSELPKATLNVLLPSLPETPEVPAPLVPLAELKAIPRLSSKREPLETGHTKAANLRKTLSKASNAPTVSAPKKSAAAPDAHSAFLSQSPAATASLTQKPLSAPRVGLRTSSSDGASQNLKPLSAGAAGLRPARFDASTPQPAPPTADTHTRTKSSRSPRFNLLLMTGALILALALVFLFGARGEKHVITSFLGLATNPELQHSVTDSQPAEVHFTSRGAQSLAHLYEETGIWVQPPTAPTPSLRIAPNAVQSLDALYTTSNDRGVPSQYVLTLPKAEQAQEDSAPRIWLSATEPSTPTPPSSVGTSLGAQNDTFKSADVFTLSNGEIPAPRPRPADRKAKPADPENLVKTHEMAGFSPNWRPTGLIERNAPANLGGLTRSEFGEFHPRMRPKSAQDDTASLVQLAADALKKEPSAIEPASTAPVITASDRPRTRPTNSAKLNAAAQTAASAVVAAAIPAPKSTPTPSAPAAVAPAARPAAPTSGATTNNAAANRVTAAVPKTKIPSSTATTVARAATVENAINLRKINLIGVYGSKSDRRALVRLSSGRLSKVKVGDRLNGGRVQSITDSALTYVKGSRALKLQVGG